MCTVCLPYPPSHTPAAVGSSGASARDKGGMWSVGLASQLILSVFLQSEDTVSVLEEFSQKLNEG